MQSKRDKNKLSKLKISLSFCSYGVFSCWCKLFFPLTLTNLGKTMKCPRIFDSSNWRLKLKLWSIVEIAVTFAYQLNCFWLYFNNFTEKRMKRLFRRLKHPEHSIIKRNKYYCDYSYDIEVCMYGKLRKFYQWYYYKLYSYLLTEIFSQRIGS